MGSEVETTKEASPLAVSTYTIRQVPFDAPYNWLAAGWRDMSRVPRVSLILAAIVFTISAIAVPLLTTVPVDVVTAATMSVGACRKNPKAMAQWAALIVGGMVLGFVTLFFGLVIAFPLFGYATWHAFRDLLVRSSF
jgi:hypothetical protein